MSEVAKKEAEEEIKENKRISTIKQQVLNPNGPSQGPAPMMTGAKYVGMTNELVLKKEFLNKEEWEEFYYNSGKERSNKINQFIKVKEKELKERGSKRVKVPNSWVEKFIQENNLRKSYGRTEKELDKLGEILYRSISRKIIPKYEEYIEVAKNLTLEDCQNYVKEVVIDNSWVGEVKRALNAIKKLEKEGIKGFQKTSGDIDVKRSVDYELKSGKGKIGIQIKPEGFNPSIDKNNKRAQEKFEGRVFTIKADKDGNIKNEEVVDKIREEVKRLSQ